MNQQIKTRPTIALFTHGADPNDNAIWSGAATAAQQFDANLVCFPGKPLRSTYEYEFQSNLIYDLIRPQRFDGLVIWLAGITPQVGLDEVKAFLERFTPIPIVTIGVSIEGYPSVLIDNYTGMHKVLNHLIEVHQRSRIVFIKGPEYHQEAQERYRAYMDVLNEHGIPFDPQLVVPGDFRESGGVKAVAEILDQRKISFDALAAACDNMAIGAMNTLHERGFKIPSDVSIVGLNDEAQSSVVSPPLTTASLFFHEQARLATEMAFKLINGEPVHEKVVLSPTLFIRQSCGCPDPMIIQAVLKPAEIIQSTVLDLPVRRSQLAHDILLTSVDAEFTKAIAPHLPQLLDAFFDSLESSRPDMFLSLLAEELRLTSLSANPISNWHSLLSDLRRLVWPSLTDRIAILVAENIWHQARVMIGKTAERVNAFQVLQMEQRLRIFGEVNYMFSITTDINELAERMARAMSRINLPGYMLCLYEDPGMPLVSSKLISAYEKHKPVEIKTGGIRFPSRELVPQGFFADDRQYNLIVEPLFFSEDQLGFIVIETEARQIETYEILAQQISGTIKSTILTEHNIGLFNQAVEARKVAEEANQFKSRFLSMVSHELRTPLSLIVGTIEMMVQSGKINSQVALPKEFRKDMDVIYTSAQHLFRLIGDVLDLASDQAEALRLAQRPLDLGTMLREVALLSESMARDKHLRWRIEIPDNLPFVMGDRTRLRQVTLNLVSNAVKYTEHGEVTLSVMLSGNSITVMVSDTGIGIPLDEQKLIFDEFGRSNRSVTHGYGGIGLGLAISRRLIELHSGKIGVCSTGEEGSGSTFYYTLPVLEKTAAANSKPTDRSQKVLLLVEKQSDKKLEIHLNERGFDVEVMETEKTPNWMKQVLASPPGAVVLGYQPAKEWGWDIMKIFKSNSATQDIIVIFYSFSETEDNSSLLEMDYLTKPVNSVDLVNALERAGLRKESYPTQKTILLVDDEPSILNMHKKMIKNRFPEYHILEAVNGREALAVMDQTKPDLILLDLMMPKMNGFDVIKAMKNRPKVQGVPVIVLTAQILTEQDMAFLQKGVAAVMGKGLFSTNEVMTQVEKVLSRSKRLGNDSQRIVRRAMAYIHEHFAESISRPDLACYLSVGERHLTASFRQETGITPIAYLNRYRIRQARTLLDNGKTSISEVAVLVGFPDINYFGRVFRKEVGLSPTAYLSRELPSGPLQP